MNEYKLTMSDGTSTTISAERFRRMPEGFIFETQGQEPLVIPRGRVIAWEGPQPNAHKTLSDEIAQLAEEK